ncbi:hypothetical protein [Streptomyces griseus]|uniref:hypothetical protein n=1 Tax=Streptomyces griseus TaxID=1911 RepID=UPI0037BB584E
MEQLLVLGTRKKVSSEAVAGTRAALGRVLAEVLDGAGTLARQGGEAKVSPAHLLAAIAADDDLAASLAAWSLTERQAAPSSVTPHTNTQEETPAATAHRSLADELAELVGQVTKQVYSDGSIGLGPRSQDTCVDLANSLAAQLGGASAHIADRVKSDVISADDVRTALLVLLQDELGQLTVRAFTTAAASADKR